MSPALKSKTNRQAENACGVVWSLIMSLNMNSKSWWKDCVSLKRSTGKPETPGALLLARCRMAFWISSDVVSHGCPSGPCVMEKGNILGEGFSIEEGAACDDVDM